MIFIELDLKKGKTVRSIHKTVELNEDIKGLKIHRITLTRNELIFILQNKDYASTLLTRMQTIPNEQGIKAYRPENPQILSE